MAINETNPNINVNADVQPKPQPQAQQTQHTGKVGNSTFTFADLAGGFDVINDSLMKLESTFNELIEKRLVNSKLDYYILPLDHHNYRDLAMDTILVGVRPKGYEFVGMFAIAIAKSQDILGTDQSVELAGRRYPIDIYPTQIFNERGIDRFFATKMSELVVGDNTMIAFAGGTVLYIDETNLEDSQEMLRIMVNAISAALHTSYEKTMDHTGSINDIDLAKHNKSEELICERKVLNGVVLDAHNRPLRADFQFTINSNNLAQNNGAKFGSQSLVKEVNSVTGYVDCLMVSPTQTGPSSSVFHRARPVFGQDGNNMEMYAANIVFTSLSPSKHQTLGNMLWSLACGVAASWDGEWWARQGINPNNAPKDNPLSVAGLGYEINLAQNTGEFAPLPVESPDFTDAAWENILGTYFTGKVIYSIRIPEGGADSWKYNDFVSAAYEQNPNDANSYSQKILARADYLTSGAFSRHYAALGGTGRPVSAMNGRMFIEGAYRNPAGQNRSLQDFGRAFLLNTVNGSVEAMEMVRDWTMAQVDEGLETTQRLGIEGEIMRQVLPHAQVTGYSMQLDFESAFIEALQRGMAECGVFLTNNNVQVQSNQFYYATYANGSMIDNMQANLLRAAAPRQNGNSGMFRRW